MGTAGTSSISSRFSRFSGEIADGKGAMNGLGSRFLAFGMIVALRDSIIAHADRRRRAACLTATDLPPVKTLVTGFDCRSF